MRKLQDIGLDLTPYEVLMARMPGFRMVGAELRAYLEKMIGLGTVLIEEDERGLTGLIGFYANDALEKKAYVSAFVVASRVEGQGVAAGLFDRFRELASSAGMRRCALNVIRDNNRALAFYRKMGLEVCGAGRDDVHWLMEGNLGGQM